MTLPRSWFLPKDESVLTLLIEQWRTVRASIDAVAAWSTSSRSLAEATADVNAAIDTERDQQRSLHRAVRSAFSTPLDAEDIYELGERLSRLHRQLYRLLLEAATDTAVPSPALAEMIATVAEASGPLDLALTRLPAPAAADAADDTADLLEDADLAYRSDVRRSPQADPWTEINEREMYRRAELVVDAMLAVAHRAWYAVSKVS